MNPRSTRVAVLTVLSVILLLLGATPGRAYFGCDQVSKPPFGSAPGAPTGVYGSWPDYAAESPAGLVPGPFGTKRWSFRWQVNSEGLELLDVAYGTDPANRRLFAKKISLAYILTRYEQPGAPAHPTTDPVSCNVSPATGQAWIDTPQAWMMSSTGATMHCSHVPSTVCDLGGRRCETSGPNAGHCFGDPTTACASDADCIARPLSGALDPADPECSGSGNCTPCNGVCIGTQVELGGLELGGVNEQVSGSSQADVVLTSVFLYGGYQFVQRYRFKDDGRLVASLRFGGIYQVDWHQHAVYWRIELAPEGDAANDVIETCVTGTCSDSPVGWTRNACGCGITPSVSDTIWRSYDLSTVAGGIPLRSIVVSPGPNDGAPESVAATSVCGTPLGTSGSAADAKDYCALRVSSSLVNEGLTPDPFGCSDGLDLYAAGKCKTEGDIDTGGPAVLYYLAHFTDHDPCSPAEQVFCEPHVGSERALGPLLELKGAW